MINLIVVGIMMIAAVGTLFFWVRVCEAGTDFNHGAMYHYETCMILAAVIFVICLFGCIAIKKYQQTNMIKTTILYSYNNVNFIKGHDGTSGYFTSGDNTYMYELNNDIIKITNINNVNDTKRIPTVK